jgi:hypothetical protein
MPMSELLFSLGIAAFIASLPAWVVLGFRALREAERFLRGQDSTTHKRN